MKVITNRHLLPRLRINVAVHQLCHILPWFAASLSTGSALSLRLSYHCADYISDVLSCVPAHKQSDRQWCSPPDWCALLAHMQFITGLQNVALGDRLCCSVVSIRNACFVVDLQRQWPQMMVTVRSLLYLAAELSREFFLQRKQQRTRFGVIYSKTVRIL